MIQKPAIPEAWLNPAPDGSNIDILDSPSIFLTSVTTHILRNVTRPILESLGVGVPEWRLLLFIDRLGKRTLGELARSMWMDRAQINRAIHTLIEKDLLAREPDPRHASRYLLALTPAGQDILTRALAQVAERQADLLRQLSPEERRSLYSALGKLESWAKAQGDGN